MEKDKELNDIQKNEHSLEHEPENESEYLSRCEDADVALRRGVTNLESLFSTFEELTSYPVDTELDELEPSLDNAIRLNIAYQSMLKDLVQQLEVLRVVNIKNQKKLHAEIEVLKASENKISDKPKTNAIPFAFFGMPYFKDVDYNTPPPNSDTLLAQRLGFRNISLLLLNKPVSHVEERKICTGLKEQAIMIEAARLFGLREELLKQLNHTSIPEDKKREIENLMTANEKELSNVHLLPTKVLFDVPPSAFDWNKISVENFGRSRHPDQIRLHWLQYLRTGVNTNKWTIKENKLLKEFVNKYEKGVNWNQVATDMNKGRTPFACFRQFQRKFNSDLMRKSRWSNEENNLLLGLVNSCQTLNVGDIKWESLRQNFPGRTKDQIYGHLRYLVKSLDRNPFSAHEDTAILEGMKIGYSLADISLLLGKRSLFQIRKRFKSLLIKPRLNEKDWTEEEDIKLLSLDVGQLQALGPLAHLIRINYPGRNCSQLFCRYHYLRMKLTTPKDYIANLKDQRLFTETCYLSKENQKLASQIVDMISWEGCNQDVSSSLSNKSPMLKSNLLNDSKKRNKKTFCVKPKNRYCVKPKNRYVKSKRVAQKKENKLKEILSAYIAGSVAKLKTTMDSTSADEGNSESAAMPSTSFEPREADELVNAMPPAKRAKTIQTKFEKVTE